MSNPRNGHKISSSSKLPGGLHIPELQAAPPSSLGINGLVDPSDSVVPKKERSVHSPIGEEAIRGSPPTPLQLPPMAIGSPSSSRRRSASTTESSATLQPASIWSEINAPLVPLPAAPRTQLSVGSRMSPPVPLHEMHHQVSPPWDLTRGGIAHPPSKAVASPALKPSPPRTWSEAAKNHPAAAVPPSPSTTTQGSGRRNPTLWEQPAPPQRRGSLSNPDPIARPVPPAPTSSILGFMQHHDMQAPAAPSLAPNHAFVAGHTPTPPHMQTLLGPSGKHDEFHKSLIPRSVPLAGKMPPVTRLVVPVDNDRDVSDDADSSIASDLSPQVSPFTSPRTAEDTELGGIFGQMEMDSDVHVPPDMHVTQGEGSTSNEHPYGEFPSPTLFVRNINSNVEDDELRGLFEPFGPIRSMYTQCKHRGFVMISYYEIRHAQNAMQQLQGRLVRRRKLDIHYSIPKSYGGSAHSSPSPSSRSPSTFHRSSSMQRTPSGPWASTSSANSAIHSSSSAPLSFAMNITTFSPPPPPQPPPPSRLPVSYSEPLARPEAVASAGTQRAASPESSQLSSSPKSVPVPTIKTSSSGVLASGGRHHRPVATEDKSKYDMDLDRIRNDIPNKYNQKMLLAAVDERHKGTYDFFYLPIDFKNKCNVGYAFINFVRPISIIAFYQEFNNRKWEKFNSEKVCTISYARIQGKAALVQHFQNSSLMSEDKKCRPIIFHSEGPNQGEQEPFPVGPNIRTRRTVGNKTSSKSSARKSGKDEKPSPDPAQSPSSL